MTADEAASSAAGIPLRPFYGPGEADRGYAELGDPGAYPYTRGRMGSPAARRRGWIHRELSGEGSPRRSNEQLRDLLARGALGIDVIGTTRRCPRSIPTIRCASPPSAPRACRCAASRT